MKTKNFNMSQQVLSNLLGDKQGTFTLLPVTSKRAKSLAWAIKTASLEWHKGGEKTIPFEVSLSTDRETMKKRLEEGVLMARYYLATGELPSPDGSRKAKAFLEWVKFHPLEGDAVAGINLLWQALCDYKVAEGNKGGEKPPAPHRVRMVADKGDGKTTSPVSVAQEDVEFFLRLGFNIVKPHVSVGESYDN